MDETNAALCFLLPELSRCDPALGTMCLRAVPELLPPNVSSWVQISIACGHTAAQENPIYAKLSQYMEKMSVESGRGRCTFFFASDMEKVIALLSFAAMFILFWVFLIAWLA